MTCTLKCISLEIDQIICHQDMAELKKIFGALKSPIKAFVFLHIFSK